MQMSGRAQAGRLARQRRAVDGNESKLAIELISSIVFVNADGKILSAIKHLLRCCPSANHKVVLVKGDGLATLCDCSQMQSQHA